MKLRIFILLLLFTLKNMTDLFGSFLPSLQIIKLLQKKYNIFVFIGMTLGLLVFKNVKILFLTWHTGDDSGKKYLMFGNLVRTENSVVVVIHRNFWKGFLIPVIPKILFTSSHLLRGHIRPAAHGCFGVFSVSVCFIPSSYCRRLRLVRRLLETSILRDCYLEDISKYIM